MFNKRIFFIAVIFLIAVNVKSQVIRKVKVTELEKRIAESNGPLIVVFWATFCKPCVEEIPYFEKEVKEHTKDGVQILLVSLDLQDYYPARIKAFVAKRKFTAPILWLDESNADYFCPKVDSAWSGAIPASLFVNNKTGYRRFFEEQLIGEKLQKEMMAVLGKTN